MSEVSPKKNNKPSIIIALLSIVVIVQAIKIYTDSQKKEQLQNTITITKDELSSTLTRLDSIKIELDQKITQIQKLGGDVSELQKAKTEVEAQLRRSTARSSKEIAQLKDKVEGYTELLKTKDEEIEKLKSVNKELFSENKTLKTKQNKLSDSITTLSKNKNELANKVAIASQLRIENAKVTGINSKGKERESPFKNKQLSKLKVEFNLAENKVAPIEGKKILIRIIDENKQVIFDVAKGSGTFTLNGKDEFYTAMQEILFDNTKQKMTFFYEKGSEYASGNYTIEVYTENYKMGSAPFTIK
jgi:DNA repair exonuclease SbcCD ATPase subunit